MTVAPQPPAAAPRPVTRRLRRTALILAVLLGCAGAAGLATEGFGHRPDLMLIRRVRPGMTEADVAAIFGTRPTPLQPPQFALRPGRTPKHWYCDAGIVRVYFGPDGRVIYGHAVSYDSQPHPLRFKLYRLLRPIGLGWLIF
jgi:hypothetical protein